MPNRVAISNLDASTIDIINVIRANASAEYQSQVPTVTTEVDLPKVGEILYGYPALANQFITALINRIAAVKVKSATFNNAYANLKKGYLAFGETVEEVFVNITKARGFSVEKAPAREFKRSLPDVRAAFHTMNYRAQYPITIQKEDLRLAFTSMSGVEDLIARIVSAISTSAEYDEFLLFKYLIIKGVTHGKMYPVAFDPTDLKTAAENFRGFSNKLTFMSGEYNASHVVTTTPKADQFIFMDAMFNAQFDVNVLASAFNMDRAMFMGNLKLIDDFTTFDNDRFSEIMADTECMELVTSDELDIMSHVKAILIDGEWFQIYDLLAEFSETYVASGLYWNYFYNVWKTVSSSPFSNAIVFVDNTASVSAPLSVTVEVTDKSVGENATVITLTPDFDDANVTNQNYQFIQGGDAVTNGVAVHKYGVYMFPANASGVDGILKMGNNTYVSASDAIATTLDVGDTVTFNSGLTLSALTIGALSLTPTFAASKTVYTATTSNTKDTITATATDTNATVEIKNGTTTVTSGSDATWSAGKNTVTITVTGTNGEKAVYTVEVTKS